MTIAGCLVCDGWILNPIRTCRVLAGRGMLPGMGVGEYAKSSSECSTQWGRLVTPIPG